VKIHSNSYYGHWNAKKWERKFAMSLCCNWLFSLHPEEIVNYSNYSITLTNFQIDKVKNFKHFILWLSKFCTHLPRDCFQWVIALSGTSTEEKRLAKDSEDLSSQNFRQTDWDKINQIILLKAKKIAAFWSSRFWILKWSNSIMSKTSSKFHHFKNIYDGLKFFNYLHN